MADRLLTKRDVRDRTGLGYTTIWRRERAGKFPRRRLLTPGRVAWLESEIEEWMRDRPRVDDPRPT